MQASSAGVQGRQALDTRAGKTRQAGRQQDKAEYLRLACNDMQPTTDRPGRQAHRLTTGIREGWDPYGQTRYKAADLSRGANIDRRGQGSQSRGLFVGLQTCRPAGYMMRESLVEGYVD